MEDGAELRAIHAGPVCSVGKGAITAVAIQNVLAVLAYIQVGVTVVVVVAPDTAQAVGIAGRRSILRHITECAVSIVAVERVANLDAALVEVAAIDEIDVLPAVAVI